jgi:hypothetical protein
VNYPFYIKWIIKNFLKDNKMSITIDLNTWPEFQGLYFLDGFFDYIIDNRAYNKDLLKLHAEMINEILNDWDRVPSFNVDTNGSQILAITFGNTHMLYQIQGNSFIELTPRQLNTDFSNIHTFTFILHIPQPNGQEINNHFQELPLTSLVDLMDDIRMGLNQRSFDDILNYLNHTLEMDRLPPRARTVYTFNIGRQATGVYTINNQIAERIQGNRPILPRQPAMGRRPLSIPSTANAAQLLQYFQSQIRPLTEREIEIRNSLDVSDPTMFNIERMDRQSRGMDGLVVSEITRIIPNTSEENDDVVVSEITRIIPNTSEENDNLRKQSYEVLVSQLYGFPVKLPEFLIINGMRVNFISYDEVIKLQIERWIVEPILQPWGGPPIPYNTISNKILTIFGKNGITYLSKVLFNPNTNKVFKPI